MEDSVFRHRGVKPVLDTTQEAEWDIAGYQIPNETVESMGRRLRDVTFSDEDTIIGVVRLRTLFGYDVVFFVGRDGENTVITIAGVRPTAPEETLELVRKVAERLALYRGATGV